MSIKGVNVIRFIGIAVSVAIVFLGSELFFSKQNESIPLENEISLVPSDGKYASGNNAKKRLLDDSVAGPEVFGESTSALLIGLDKKRDIKEMGAREVALEVEAIKGYFSRHDIIGGLNNDAYSEDEREDINAMIVYLNELRKHQIDTGIVEIENDIEQFRVEVDGGEYPELVTLSDVEIAEIYARHNNQAEVENTEVKQKIAELSMLHEEDDLRDLGI